MAEEATARGWLKTEFPPFYTKACREGWRKWRAECEPKLIRDQHLLPANTCWKIDRTTADYYVNDNGRKRRPTAINVVDVSSNLVVGWAVGRSESQEVILRALRRGIERYGIPLKIRTDLGKAFQGQSIADRRARSGGYDGLGILESLGITYEPCQGYTPEQRSNSESVFNSFRQRWCPITPGFIGNNHKARVPGVHRWADEHLDQIRTLSEDDAIVGKFFETENIRPGKRPLENPEGLSPLQRFERTAIPERFLAEDKHRELLDFLFTRATASAKTIRRENLRHAAGAEGMTAGGGGLSLDDLQGAFPTPDMDAGPDLTELSFDGQGGPQDDAFARLVETSNDDRGDRTED